MSEKLLSQKVIADRAGIAPSTVHYIINGDREPSKRMCEKLMEATGVIAAAWLWPEDIYNPYIPFDSCAVDGRLWQDVELNATRWAESYKEEYAKYLERWGPL